MQGDLVIVRAYGGVPLVRRVWDEDRHGVYVTDDEHFERLLTGDDEIAPPTAGFPREDVFKYESVVAESVEDLQKGQEWDWNRLTQY